MTVQAPLMREVSCNLCGGREYDAVADLPPYRMVGCRSCGLVYLSPRPVDEAFPSLYQDYHPVRMEDPDSWGAYMKSIFISTGALLDRMAPSKGTVLDVGCGFGFFVEEMKKRGWRSRGIDLSEGAVEFAKSRGLDVEVGALDAIGIKEGSLDAVTMFYVLEHVTDPLATLRDIRRLLRPGGVLVARVPHTTPIVKLLKALGIKNNLYDPPFHLSDFSPATIKMMLEKAGFTGIRTCIGGGTLPVKTGPRIVSTLSTVAAQALEKMSGSMILLPGVSKTTVALRA